MTQTLMTKLNKALLYQYIFYKNFYKFIFLHKPLCPRYQNYTIKIFGLYVCKSCFLLYSAFILTLILLIPKIKVVMFDKFFWIGFAGCVLTLLVTYPPIYSKFGRVTKDFIRFYDGIFLAAVFVVCFKFNLYIGFASILGFIIVRNIFNKKRTGDRVCKDCEHVESEETCVGYLEQKEALLKIEEEYSKIRMGQINKERKNYD